MPKIIRSTGLTKSERYLARLADRTFLNLWAYPNVYRDVVVNGHRTGKELCDLLVVCGDHVIIFSDKTIEWPQSDDLNVAWRRWFQRAIKKSVKQIRGAERWITENPERIFIDQACTQKLPIKLPPRDRMKLHCVAVALGAHKACSEFFSGDSGSFMVRPDLTGDAHIDPSSPEYAPFTIGDVDPDGAFIHVVNDITLDILMKELDTISDLSSYLQRKEEFFRSGHLLFAAGEEELLAQYLTHMNSDSEHDFIHPDNRPWRTNERIAFDQGFYASMLANDQYRRKKEADKVSYIWDRLITAFTDHMLAGTTSTTEGSIFNLDQHALGVRYMAQEPRTMRRMLGEGIYGALEKSKEQDRVFRSMLPTPKDPGDGTAYVFMTLAHPKEKLDGGYSQYRKVRANMLQIYCEAMLHKHRHLKRIIGIATEPFPSPDRPSGSSEDMIYAEPPSIWTPEYEAELSELCNKLNILRENSITRRDIHVDEYPKKEEIKGPERPQPNGPNRHYRRAMKSRKKEK